MSNCQQVATTFSCFLEGSSLHDFFIHNAFFSQLPGCAVKNPPSKASQDITLIISFILATNFMSMEESYCSRYYITDFIVDDHQIMGGYIGLSQGHECAMSESRSIQ